MENDDEQEGHGRQHNPLANETGKDGLWLSKDLYKSSGLNT
jgi:hypothetical protein